MNKIFVKISVCLQLFVLASIIPICVEAGTPLRGTYLAINFKSYPSVSTSRWETMIEESDQVGLLMSTSKFGNTIGGQAEMYLDGLCLRGIYDAGLYKYHKSGTAHNYTLGADIGFAGELGITTENILILGYRKIQSKRTYNEWFEINNSNLGYSEWIIGGVLRSKLNKQGFIFNIEVDCSIRGIISWFKDEQNQWKHQWANIILDIGYRFEDIPLAVEAGLEAQVYQFVYKERRYPGIRFSDFFPKEFDGTYGFILKIAYVYNLQ